MVFSLLFLLTRTIFSSSSFLKISNILHLISVNQRRSSRRYFGFPVFQAALSRMVLYENISNGGQKCRKHYKPRSSTMQ
jgi:hypothetical protein